ncbi:MAG: ribosome-associated translation inhibitor RaiA [Melioribacteraceae bacterium]|nr:ribosome-associated translation inhibitor RaiA [Melioribacteraceae bacterium]
MNINITSRKFKAKDSLKDLITAEVKSLEKFNDDILDVDVILSYRHNKDSIKMAELSLQLPRKTIVISEESENFEKSVSVSVDKLKRQLKQIKSRKKIRPTKV